ncbi:MAG: hypothetical protein Q3966_10155, partial [Neisseria sp.]|nr:hypothetical protein [Neisseria sp.]
MPGETELKHIYITTANGRRKRPVCKDTRAIAIIFRAKAAYPFNRQIQEKTMSTRTEHDTMGNVEVPSEAYWG